MGFGQNALVTALAIAPSQGNTIYAATSDGHLYVTQNDGALWQERDSGLPANQVRFIAVSPSNPSEVFLVPCPGAWSPNLSGPSHVLMSTDGGLTWGDVRGDLPASADTTTLAVDWRYSTPVLYVGTLNGVYRSTDLQHWSGYATGLPNAEDYDLEFLPQFNLLAVATYGRGTFEILVPGPPTVTVTSSASTSTYGQSLTFTATVAPSGSGFPTPTESVQFQVNGVDLGPAIALVNGIASMSTTALPAGSDTITARYLGDSVYGPASGSLTQTVNPLPGNTPTPTPTPTSTSTPTPTSPTTPTPGPIPPAPAQPPTEPPHHKKRHGGARQPKAHQHPGTGHQKHRPTRHGKLARTRVAPVQLSDGMGFGPSQPT
jgi:hypothetical protein